MKNSRYKARNYLLEQLGCPIPKSTYIPTGNPRGRKKGSKNKPKNPRAKEIAKVTSLKFVNKKSGGGKKK